MGTNDEDELNNDASSIVLVVNFRMFSIPTPYNAYAFPIKQQHLMHACLSLT
jgi:hypothetical protein